MSDPDEPSELEKNLAEVEEAFGAGQLPKDLEQAGNEMDGGGVAGFLKGWGGTTEGFGDAISRAGTALRTFGEGMGEEVAEQGRKDGGLVGETVAGTVGEAAEAVTEVTGEFVGGLTEGAGDFVSGTGQALEKYGEGLDDLKNGDIGEGLGKIADGAGHFLKGTTEAVGEIGWGTLKTGGEAVEGVYETGGALVGPLAREVASAAKDGFDFMTQPIDVAGLLQEAQERQAAAEAAVEEFNALVDEIGEKIAAREAFEEAQAAARQTEQDKAPGAQDVSYPDQDEPGGVAGEGDVSYPDPDEGTLEDALYPVSQPGDDVDTADEDEPTGEFNMEAEVNAADDRALEEAGLRPPEDDEPGLGPLIDAPEGEAGNEEAGDDEVDET